MEIATIFGSLIIPTVIIGILIFIHEFGHFIAAKRADIEVQEFAFGFGPRLIGFFATTKGFEIRLPFDKSFRINKIKVKKNSETEYKINLFPIGGYVKMLGEEQSVNDPRSYSAKPVGKRFVVIVAGVIMNALLAAFLFYIVLANQSFVTIIPRLDVFNYNFIGTETTERVIISDVVPNSPADQAGLEAFDEVLSLNGTEVGTNSELADIVDANIGSTIVISVQKHDSTDTAVYDVYARPNPPEGEGSM
ncbi:site-2 protease family protein, partial [Candidatus Dojkabacteria bacterium]|nr:site-2 protease family protein [Candidatus Dojkabacteria bacterium]